MRKRKIFIENDETMIKETPAKCAGVRMKLIKLTGWDKRTVPVSH